ncbi:MAG TPA: DEAD/DEAH box helicase family protein [Candidatus Competibacteraceae bacterium]|nr:DEAD/DEAH box helicase family protein [Candidatus Competibacteraceae bacterium]MCP5132937.1 DEAD/DEAH box helicase [Gammaproteobacteria bacterium]HRX71311.1 DEAD/DEAH box helicase family protein [Candidatus Competibacteraceae bacterium]
MKHRTYDSPGIYRTGGDGAARQLRFDRGTLLLEGVAELPPGLESWFQYDPRIEAYRAPAHRYSEIIGPLKDELTRNKAPRYQRRELICTLEMNPYPHQQEALAAWQAAKGRGVVVLPTGAGKTLVGLLALSWARRDGLIMVPTLDLMHQWYALLRAAFPDQEIGLIGGGYHEPQPLTIATYDSAARHVERLGDRFGLLVFDEAHHLPSEFYRSIAEFSLAPYRLGLTATPERSDGRDADLLELIGPIVYRRRPEQLAGSVLADFQIRTVHVDLSPAERTAYQQALEDRNTFLQASRLSLSSLEGWNRFVMLSARSTEGRRAMRAHREARRIAHATPAKLRTLGMILANHPGAKAVIFTEDNATAYEVAQRFLIPCLTHQTAVKERQDILERFKSSDYLAIVTSNVLNEGVDVPDASIGVILSGSASAREFVQRLGRILRRGDGKQAVLYEVIARETREEQVAGRRRTPPNTGHHAERIEATLALFDTQALTPPKA